MTTDPFAEAAMLQGLDPAAAALTAAGIPHTVHHTGGMCMAVKVDAPDGWYTLITYDADRLDEQPYPVGHETYCVGAYLNKDDCPMVEDVEVWRRDSDFFRWAKEHGHNYDVDADVLAFALDYRDAMECEGRILRDNVPVVELAQEVDRFLHDHQRLDETVDAHWVTVAEMREMLANQDDETVIVIATDGWYDNIGQLILPGSGDLAEHMCVTLSHGSPFDSRQQMMRPTDAPGPKIIDRNAILAEADRICALAGLDPHDVEEWGVVKRAILNLHDDDTFGTQWGEPPTAPTFNPDLGDDNVDACYLHHNSCHEHPAETPSSDDDVIVSGDWLMDEQCVECGESIKLGGEAGSASWGWKHVPSGAEHCEEGDERVAAPSYRVGYRARITGHYSFGVTVSVTRDVLERFVLDCEQMPNHTLTEADADVLIWDDDEVLYIHTGPSGGPGPEVFHLRADAEGRYPLPSWTWAPVTAEECAEVVPPITEAVESRVIVPGQLIARYSAGAITKWTFVPRAGDAGYFGPAAELWEGDEDLDIEESTGPFWTAVQSSFQDDDTLRVTWEE